MFEGVYTNPDAKSEEKKAEDLVKTLYEYYGRHMDQLPRDLLELMDRGEPKEKILCDYISAMTDRFATAKYEEIFIPQCWHR